MSIHLQLPTAGRDAPPLNILFLSAELAPIAKVGGLADVAGALPKALNHLGQDVRVMVPRYGCIVNADIEIARFAGRKLPSSW